jgi:hypothetical protein
MACNRDIYTFFTFYSDIRIEQLREIPKSVKIVGVSFGVRTEHLHFTASADFPRRDFW